jgi:hypothetical protein
VRTQLQQDRRNEFRVLSHTKTFTVNNNMLYISKELKEEFKCSHLIYLEVTSDPTGGIPWSQDHPPKARHQLWVVLPGFLTSWLEIGFPQPHPWVRLIHSSSSQNSLLFAVYYKRCRCPLWGTSFQEPLHAQLSVGKISGAQSFWGFMETSLHD